MFFYKYFNKFWFSLSMAVMIELVMLYTIWNNEHTDAQNYTVLNECPICHLKGGQILMFTGQNLIHSINPESSFANPTQRSVKSREGKFTYKLIIQTYTSTVCYRVLNLNLVTWRLPHQIQFLGSVVFIAISILASDWYAKIVSMIQLTWSALLPNLRQMGPPQCLVAKSAHPICCHVPGSKFLSRLTFVYLTEP
jgi:hypothetical protein